MPPLTGVARLRSVGACDTDGIERRRTTGDRDRREETMSDTDRRSEPFVEGLSFGECPRWHDGRLWYSDFYVSTVSSVGETRRRPGRARGAR